MVRLWLNIKINYIYIEINFNSIMVRLWRNKYNHKDLYFLISIPLWFDYDNIAFLPYANFFWFQFHYGSIMTYSFIRLLFVCYYFNSIMVRLWQSQISGETFIFLNFNSIMVRLWLCIKLILKN